MMERLERVRRARTYQWFGEAASDMAPTAQNIFFLGNRMPEQVPPSAIKFYEDRLVTQFRAADDQLARTPYLTGNDITLGLMIAVVKAIVS